MQRPYCRTGVVDTRQADLTGKQRSRTGYSRCWLTRSLEPGRFRTYCWESSNLSPIPCLHLGSGTRSEPRATVPLWRCRGVLSGDTRLFFDRITYPTLLAISPLRIKARVWADIRGAASTLCRLSVDTRCRENVGECPVLPSWRRVCGALGWPRRSLRRHLDPQPWPPPVRPAMRRLCSADPRREIPQHCVGLSPRPP